MTRLILVMVTVVVLLQFRSLSSNATYSQTIQGKMNTSLDNESQRMISLGASEYKTLQPLLLSPKGIFNVTTDKPLDNVQHYVSSITTTATQDENEPEKPPNTGSEFTHKRLNLSSESITNCILKQRHLHFVATEGLLILDSTDISSKAHERPLVCSLTVTVPSDHVFCVQIGLKHQIRNAFLTFSLAESEYKLISISSAFESRLPPEIHSFTNKVTFVYKLYNSRMVDSPVYLRLSFVAIPFSDRPHLELIKTTSMA
ncbi:hypothetical protein BaRGS_00036991, partial [Batillaria attramentaria]